MVHLLQRPAGVTRRGRRKMECVLLWLILSGTVRETFSATDVSDNDEQRKPVSNYFNREISDTNASSKKNSEYSPVHKNSNTLFTSNGDEIHNSENSLSKFHTPNDILHIALSGDNEAVKRHDTIIPMVRFGRANEGKRQGNSNSVIPYPRLGRSVNVNANQGNEKEIVDVQKYKADAQKIENFGVNDQAENSLEDYDTVVFPYSKPRMDYLYSEIMPEKRYAEESDTDYILPQMRYGKSMVSFPSTNADETAKGKLPHTFILPYPRPGRSNKYRMKVGSSEAQQLILPYPRPGRSDGISTERLKSYKEHQRYMLPFARLGRSTVDTLYELEGKASMYSDDEGFLSLKINPFLLKSEEKHFSEKPKEKIESTSVFIIPYPRPGKKSVFKMNNVKGKQMSGSDEKKITDYVLPYPRPGRRSAKQQVIKLKNNSDQNPNIQSQNFVLPYPRPGRSVDNAMEANDEIHQNNLDINESIKSRDFENNNIIDFDGFKDADLFQYDDETNEPDYESSNDASANIRFKRSTAVVPYPRLGRSNSAVHNPKLKTPNFVVPQLRFGRSNSIVPYPRFGRYDSIVPYPRLGRSDDRVKRSDSDVLQARFDRSESLVPYPRPGRSDAMVPYPRPGRSGGIVPYPRPGRSNVLIPYPRPGRSSGIVPYPRPGRSSGIVPYPRPGRSGVVPYPRPGRSEVIVPYPRPGRSSGVVPYPRPGRSEVIVPYPRPGRSEAIVPYPRPGRSSDVVPYPRPGRSSGVVPYPRPGRSGGIVPYPRPGRSEVIVPYPRPGRSSGVVPYPRPGRSEVMVPYPRPGRSNTVVPYPRTGKSLSVVPYPRLGRAVEEKISSKNFKLRENWLLPNIRPGRSILNTKDDSFLSYPKREVSGSATSQINKEEFTPTFFKKDSNKYAVIPYPRLGRSKKGEGNTSPQRSFERLEKDLKDERNIDDTDTIIPYPRPGRSQKLETPSAGVVNSVHKLNKHMLNNAENSVYLLQYPRPGRSFN